MSDKPLKCYYVWDDPDQGGVLVHAETAGKAKSIALHGWPGFYDLGSEFITLKAHRIPTLDALPLTLDNSLTVLRWENTEYTDDGEEIPPFANDAEYWAEFCCHCPICEAYRKGE